MRLGEPLPGVPAVPYFLPPFEHGPSKRNGDPATIAVKSALNWPKVRGINWRCIWIIHAQEIRCECNCSKRSLRPEILHSLHGRLQQRVISLVAHIVRGRVKKDSYVLSQFDFLAHRRTRNYFLIQKAMNSTKTMVIRTTGISPLPEGSSSGLILPSGCTRVRIPFQKSMDRMKGRPKAAIESRRSIIFKKFL